MQELPFLHLKRRLLHRGSLPNDRRRNFRASIVGIRTFCSSRLFLESLELQIASAILRYPCDPLCAGCVTRVNSRVSVQFLSDHPVNWRGETWALGFESLNARVLRKVAALKKTQRLPISSHFITTKS